MEAAKPARSGSSRGPAAAPAAEAAPGPRCPAPGAPHHGPGHRGAIPGSPPSQEKPPYLLYGAAAAPGSPAAAPTAAAPRSLNRCSSKLPFLALPLIHKPCRGQQRQVETTFLLEEVGSLLRTRLNRSLRLPTHLPFRSILHFSSSLSSAAADREQPIGIEDSLSGSPSHKNTPSASEIL